MEYNLIIYLVGVFVAIPISIYLGIDSNKNDYNPSPTFFVVLEAILFSWISWVMVLLVLGGIVIGYVSCPFRGK